MKKDLYIITGITVFSTLFLNACRSTDTDHSITNGIASVNINLLGTEFSGSSPSANASLSKNTNLNTTSEAQTHSILVNPGTVVTAKLASNSVSTPAIASSGIKSTAVVSGNTLGSGIKFRVIAYRQSNGNYHTHQDYTVGQAATPMMLDNGAAYNFVVYSYGTTGLPSISSGEQTNISSASVNYDDTNRDLMYQKISYTPVDNGNILNITLRHKVAQITTIINSAAMGDITGITGGVLTNHYTNGVFSLSTGVMSGRTVTSSGAVLSFPASGFPGVNQTSDPVFINNDTGGTATAGISASITIGGNDKLINLPSSFKITPGNKSTLTINLNKCGAYLGAGNTLWKGFMCHNLGADTNADPFIPAAAIHGAKYKWGSQTNQTARYYSQSKDQSSAGSAFSPAEWSTEPIPESSWSDTSKTSKDPCPSGYRVPTIVQWQAVVANNNIERIGSWADSANNYTTAVYFRDASNVRTLMLPIAGYRYSSNAILFVRGSEAYYWSSSRKPTSFAGKLGIFSTSVNFDTSSPQHGFSVRCIAE